MGCRSRCLRAITNLTDILARSAIRTLRIEVRYARLAGRNCFNDVDHVPTLTLVARARAEIRTRLLLGKVAPSFRHRQLAAGAAAMAKSAACAALVRAMWGSRAGRMRYKADSEYRHCNSRFQGFQRSRSPPYRSLLSSPLLQLRSANAAA